MVPDGCLRYDLVVNHETVNSVYFRREFKMQKTKQAMALLAIVVLLLAGCTGVHGRHEAAGGLLGGIAGGIAGAQIGDGTGQIAAIIGGTILGAALGSYVGGYMDRVDQLQMTRALETQPTGQVSQWRNPDTGRQFHVTPVKTFQRDGQYCREFVTRVEIGGRTEQAFGTACRMPDGSWKVVQ
jgi:surface antigen